MNRKPHRKSEEISVKQAYALGVMTVLIKRNPDVPPSLEEVARYLDMTRQAVSTLWGVLQRKGYIDRPKGSRRSVQLTGKELPYSTQKGRTA